MPSSADSITSSNEEKENIHTIPDVGARKQDSDQLIEINVPADKDGGDYESNRLFVSNFPFAWRDEDLSNFFVKFGPVESVEIVYNERGSKGFGFVTIKEASKCARAREALNHTIVNGRRVEIRRAHKMRRAHNSGPAGPRTSNVSHDNRTAILNHMLQNQGIHMGSSVAHLNQAALQRLIEQVNLTALRGGQQQQQSLLNNPMLLNLLLADPQTVSNTTNVLIPPAQPNPLLGGLPMYLPPGLANLQAQQAAAAANFVQLGSMASPYQDHAFLSLAQPIAGYQMPLYTNGLTSLSLAQQQTKQAAAAQQQPATNKMPSVATPGQEIPSLFDRSPYGEHLLGIGSQLGYGPLPQISGTASTQTAGSPQCAPQPYGAIGMPRVSDLTGSPIQKNNTVLVMSNNREALSGQFYSLGGTHAQPIAPPNLDSSFSSNPDITQSAVNDYMIQQQTNGTCNTAGYWMDVGRKRTADNNFSQHDQAKLMRR